MSKLLFALVLVFVLAFAAAEARRDRLYWNRNTNGNQQIRYVEVPRLSNNNAFPGGSANNDDTNIDTDSLIIYDDRAYYILQKNGNNNDQVIGTNLDGKNAANPRDAPGEDLTGFTRGPAGFYYAFDNKIVHKSKIIANTTWDGFGVVNSGSLYFMNGNQVRRLDLDNENGTATTVTTGVVQFSILGDDMYYATGNSIMVIRNFRDDPVPAADTILSGNATQTNNIQGFVAADSGLYWCNNNADINYAKLDGSNFKELIEGNNNNCAGSMQYSAAVPQVAYAAVVLVLAAVFALLY